jgi:hypothetical protein
VESASYYRQRAAEVRTEAEKVRLEDIKQQFLMIAAQYEELADMVAASERKS